MRFSLSWHLWFLVCLVALFEVSAFHFRGGILTWKSLPDNPTSIQVNYLVAWKKDFSERLFDVCTPDAVTAETPLYIGKSLYCGEQECIEDMDYVCTDYNTAGDYAAGQGSHIIPVPNGTNVFDISFRSCCWVNLQNYPVPRHYLLNATVDLTPRGNRNGLINSSPVAAVIPVQLVQQGCNHVIRIPVSDPDGDVVRCRFAEESNNECFRVCGPLANAELQSTENECVLTYDGSSPTVGWYAVTIMIEDFNRRRSRRPLSRVPLHFLINVTATDDSCHQPQFQPPTPENGECLPATVGQRKTIKLAAQSGDSRYLISGISTFGLPLGMEVSPLTSEPNDPLTFFIELGWTPRSSQVGPHQICFSAFDRRENKEFASDQVCITTFVGAAVTYPIPETSIPQPRQIIDATNQQWEIHFNSTIMQHNTEAGAIVSFIKAETSDPVHMVNLASETDPNIQFPLDDTVVFTTPGFTLEANTEYILRVHEGAVRSATSCKSKSAAHEWRFVTGPDHFLPATRFSPEEFRRPTAVPECFSSYMLIFVSKAWLATVSSLVDPAGMYLNDPSCVGEEFNETHYVLGAPHDMCGTVVESESNNVQTVENIVHIPPQPVSPGSIITRDNNIVVHVTCRLVGAKVTHAAFDPNITTIVYHETGYGTFNFQLRMFHDATFGSKYKPTNYPVDVNQKQRLYFEAKVISNEDMLMFLDSCRATPTANPRDPTYYIFIDAGCKVDDTVEFHEHPSGIRQRFSIEAFAFVGHHLHGSVFIHCDIATCFAEDSNSRCAQGCVGLSSIARRDVHQTGSSSKAYPNTDGPIRIQTTEKGMAHTGTVNTVMTAPREFDFSLVELPMLTATILLLFIILIVLVRVVKIMRRPKQLQTPMNPHRVDRIKLPSIRIGSE